MNRFDVGAGSKRQKARGAAPARQRPESAQPGRATQPTEEEHTPKAVPADAEQTDEPAEGDAVGQAEDEGGNDAETEQTVGQSHTSNTQLELGDVESTERPDEKATEELTPAEVEARLQVPLAAIELPDIALGEAIDILAQLASVPIELDVEALGDAGRGPGDRVRVCLTQTTVAEVLAAILAQHNLAFDVRQGTIWIRPR